MVNAFTVVSASNGVGWVRMELPIKTRNILDYLTLCGLTEVSIILWAEGLAYTLDCLHGS